MVRPTALFTVACFFLCSLKDAYAVSLPVGTGKYSVGTIELQLTDFSRTDPVAKNTSSTGRSFMVQLFYPATNTNKYPLAPYIKPQSARINEIFNNLPTGTLSNVQTNSHAGAPIRSCDDIQVILFSPGYSVSRQFYTTYVEDLASRGYLVVALDHPYDAIVVEFPDGTLVYADPAADMEDLTYVSKVLNARVGDATFVIDGLRGNLTKSIPGVRTRLRITEIGMFGHSFGGAASAETMRINNQIRGGLNMDGTIYGDSPNTGLGRPFALMGVPSHNLSSDTTWSSFWAKLRGWKKALVLVGAEHLAYSDYSVLISLLSLETVLTPEGVKAVIGTIDGKQANEVVRVYIRAFFDFVLGEGSDELFEEPDPQYPEISFQT